MAEITQSLDWAQVQIELRSTCTQDEKAYQRHANDMSDAI
jgi:hypothetical protein